MAEVPSHLVTPSLWSVDNAHAVQTCWEDFCDSSGHSSAFWSFISGPSEPKAPNYETQGISQKNTQFNEVTARSVWKDKGEASRINTYKTRPQPIYLQYFSDKTKHLATVLNSASKTHQPTHSRMYHLYRLHPIQVVYNVNVYFRSFSHITLVMTIQPCIYTLVETKVIQ